MTCIIGLKQNEKIWMGADSAALSGLSLNIISRKKIFLKGDFIFGTSYSVRMSQLAQFKFHPPRLPDIINEETMREYMVTEFVEKLRSIFRDGGHMKKDKEQETLEGNLLIGIKGWLYCIQNDFQVADSKHPFMAIGCGEDIALGSLYSTENKSPEDRIRMALQAAQEFSAGVREPFVIDSI